MGDLKILWICFISLAFSPGGIRSGKIARDDCSSRFLSSLIEAGYEIDNTVDLTLHLKYEDGEGAKKKAAIKLRDQCTEPKILCEGETDFLNKEMVTGPLLSCSWKWNEKDDTTRNYVIVRLNQKKAIEISGTVSRGSEKVFPHASDKGPLNFKFTAPNWNSKEGKKTYRVKRQDDVSEYDEEDADDLEDGESPPRIVVDDTTTKRPPTPRPTKVTKTTTRVTTAAPPVTTAAPPVTATTLPVTATTLPVTATTLPVTATTLPVTTTAAPASKAESAFHFTNKLTYLLWTMSVSLLIFAFV